MNNLHLPSLLIVMGVSGSGKSTFARAIATAHARHYLDADDFHTLLSKQKMQQGIPLTEKERGPWLDSICRALSRRLRRGENLVLACSGLKRAHRDRFRRQFNPVLFVFLNGDECLIRHRLEQRQGHFFNQALLADQFRTLESPLTESDVISIEVGGTSDEMMTMLEARIAETNCRCNADVKKV